VQVKIQTRKLGFTGSHNPGFWFEKTLVTWVFEFGKTQVGNPSLDRW